MTPQWINRLTFIIVLGLLIEGMFIGALGVICIWGLWGTFRKRP